MSRTTLCILTATALAILSIAVTVGRYQVLGNEVKLPTGPGSWKVTMLVHGKMVDNDARLTMAIAPDFGRQHIVHELLRSAEFTAKPRDPKHPERQQVTWLPRPGTPNGSFRARYEFYCTVDVRQPSSPMSKLADTLYAPPHGDEHLKREPNIESEDPDVCSLARRLTTGLDRPQDQLEALFRYVDFEIGNEPRVSGPGATAVECLKNSNGDSEGKSRLLAALCRNRGIPTRLVRGVTLKKGHEQLDHVWTEAWVQNHWLPMCTFYHHYGRVPPTFFIIQLGDRALVRGRGVSNLKHAFLVEKAVPDETVEAGAPSTLRHVVLRLSLYALPPAEQQLVEFLLLLPLAALIICIYRNVIGLNSFGTFAPALVGLAFRDLASLPGILVFVSIVLIGWIMRRILDSYHLLQVPRTAFMLSLVVIVLIVAILAANYQDLPATRYISLFPMVILTGMIERFWTLEVEDTTSSSFKALLGTMAIAASISLFLSLHAVVRYMFRFPETLGLVMAVQLLIGRYTGYRLSELFRFRDFLRQQPA